MTDVGTADDAWEQFAQRLAQFLVDLVEGEALILAVAQTPHYVQFLSWGEAAVHGEVSYDAGDVDRVVAVGWQAPERDRKGRSVTGSDNCQVDLPPSEAHRLAVMTVAVLRDVWGVPEPQMLCATKVNDAGGPEPGRLLIPVEDG